MEERGGSFWKAICSGEFFRDADGKCKRRRKPAGHIVHNRFYFLGKGKAKGVETRKLGEEGKCNPKGGRECVISGEVYCKRKSCCADQQLGGCAAEYIISSWR